MSEGSPGSSASIRPYEFPEICVVVYLCQLSPDSPKTTHQLLLVRKAVISGCSLIISFRTTEHAALIWVPGTLDCKTTVPPCLPRIDYNFGARVVELYQKFTVAAIPILENRFCVGYLFNVKVQSRLAQSCPVQTYSRYSPVRSSPLLCNPAVSTLPYYLLRLVSSRFLRPLSPLPESFSLLLGLGWGDGEGVPAGAGRLVPLLPLLRSSVAAVVVYLGSRLRRAIWLKLRPVPPLRVLSLVAVATAGRNATGVKNDENYVTWRLWIYDILLRGSDGSMVSLIMNDLLFFC